MAGKKRMANLELLRCVAMLMVVVLHYLGKGRLLPELTGESLGVQGVVAWLLEAFCAVAVNVYMFISGYFLCTSSFKLSRLLKLWLQVWLYSVGFGLIGMLTGVMAETSVDIHFFLTLLFPVWMEHYWFMTAYIFLYLLLPFVGIALRHMTKQQLRCTVIILLIVFSLIKSVLPLRLEMDTKGYDCIWYLCVFVAAAYVRRFGIPFLEKKGRGVLLYVVCSLLVFGGTMMLRQVFQRTGSLERMLGMCMEYNHILLFLAALGVFYAFRGINFHGKIADVIVKISPYTLGVYLLHENLGLRYTWQNWLGADKVNGIFSLLLHTILAAVIVFAAGIIVDALRALAMKGLHGILMKTRCYRGLMDGIRRVDEVFEGDKKENA